MLWFFHVSSSLFPVYQYLVGIFPSYPRLVFHRLLKTANFFQKGKDNSFMVCLCVISSGGGGGGDGGPSRRAGFNTGSINIGRRDVVNLLLVGVNLNPVFCY